MTPLKLMSQKGQRGDISYITGGIPDFFHACKISREKRTNFFGFSLLLFIAVLGFNPDSIGQHFTSANNGSWTTGSNWGGGNAPAVTGQGWGTINANHNLDINGNYSLPGGTLNIASGRTLNVNGNFTIGVGGGGTNVNVYGTLLISGNAILSANLRIHPGGTVIVEGNTTVINSNYLLVGTNVAPPPYANLVVKQNLISQNSGDVTVNRNGRVAILGNFTNTGSGGSNLTISNGGQVYINGNVNLANGGNTISNGNTTNPFGLYVNGNINNPNSSTTSNRGDETVMYNTNYPFYEWVTSYYTPLPVTLSYFKVKSISGGEVTLNWGTVSQQNFDKFEIERSVDGINYETVGELKGAGNSNELLQYSFVDKYPFAGRSYYRLKLTDLDHSVEFSPVVLAHVEAPKEVTVYPNPSSGEFLNMRANFAPQENDRVMVYDAMGIELVSLNANQITDRLEFENTLKPGTYVLKYFSEGFEKAVRVVVR